MVNPESSSTERYFTFLPSLLDILNVDIGSSSSWVDYQAETVPTIRPDHIDKTCLVSVLSSAPAPAKTQMSNIWPTENFQQSWSFSFVQPI